MIHVVVMKCLTGLPVLIHIELLRRSRSFKYWGVGVGSFVYGHHAPALHVRSLVSRKLVNQLAAQWQKNGSQKNGCRIPTAAKTKWHRQCTCKRDIEARSRNHCCRGKPVSIAYCILIVCSVSHPACRAYAPCYIVTCGLSDSNMFFHISQTAWFSEKSYWT
jgi:hypothetical protein